MAKRSVQSVVEERFPDYLLLQLNEAFVNLLEYEGKLGLAFLVKVDDTVLKSITDSLSDIQIKWMTVRSDNEDLNLGFGLRFEFEGGDSFMTATAVLGRDPNMPMYIEAMRDGTEVGVFIMDRGCIAAHALQSKWKQDRPDVLDQFARAWAIQGSADKPNSVH